MSVARVRKRGWPALTVKIVPHSTQAARSFQINIGVVLFVLVLVVGIAGASVLMGRGAFGASKLVQEREEEARISEARMESLLLELTQLLDVADRFDAALTTALGALAPSTASQTVSKLSSTLASLSAIRGEAPREISRIRALSRDLEAAVEPLTAMQAAVDTQRQLLQEIPNGWPVLGSRGRVTFEFGPNRHPFTDQWYLHKGIDIADLPGTPIVASADGVVIEAGTDPSYGHFVWLRHKYGFRTLYPHLQRIDVSEGDVLTQGQRLGTMGSSGIATGTHLHFELWLGEDVLDPAVFLKISNDFKRWRRDRSPWAQ